MGGHRLCLIGTENLFGGRGLEEAKRMLDGAEVLFGLLKKGGVLVLSDIDRMAELRDEARHAQFAVLYEEDLTEAWKQYYIECIWNGTADKMCCPGISEIKGNAQNKYGYTLIICRK